MSERSLSGFLDELAADPPGPAAGSAAGVAVAIAAAIAELAARRSGDAAGAGAATVLRAQVLRLAEADIDAYARVLGATGADRERALREAAEICEEIQRLGLELAGMAAALLENGNPNLAGEAIAARELAAAAARVAAELARMDRREAAGAPGVWRLERRVDLSSGPVAWDVFGDGPPLVLVHGTPTWSYLWRNVVPELARDFTVYLFDLPGYGDSPLPEGEISIATHTQVLVELLEHLELERPAIAGHDIGGAIVLRAHVLHRRRFKRIALLDAVVLSPWITPTTRHIQAHLDVYGTMPVHIFERVTAAHLRTAVHRPLAEDAFAAYDMRWSGRQGQEIYLRKVEGFDERHTGELERALGTLGVPVLVLWGARDAWLDPALAQRLGDLIPGSEVTLVAEAGHFVTEDAPEEVAMRLSRFFSGR